MKLTPPASGVPVPGNSDGSRTSRSTVRYTGTFLSDSSDTVSESPTSDSFPHALTISETGYNAFALIYRPGVQNACEDLSRAIAFIFEHADEFEVDTSDYSLWGGSAGARMAAWVGGYGTAAFGEETYPKPAAVIMQYTGLGEYSDDDPPTYACVGDNDGIASWRVMQARLDGMSKLGIDTEFHHYPGLGHGFGLGTGTSAEGWINDAIAFWKNHMTGE